LLLELGEHALDDLALASHCPELDDDRRVGLTSAAEASKEQQGKSQWSDSKSLEQCAQRASFETAAEKMRPPQDERFWPRC
jgi:hypothetical protein